MINIQNLHVEVDKKEILKGINLKVKPGELHVIMGRNCTGKSTLANVLVGNEKYEVTKGSVTFQGKDLLDLTPEDRACKGLFLSFQYHVIFLLLSTLGGKTCYVVFIQGAGL